ncbi:unnamed protein product [Clavelina lepadiformis]|uniref:Uncharacterized protein n=1 Tax=Clavelina lepadiformis TaxID=159417 RepID=A0ABP0GM27_CLALP
MVGAHWRFSAETYLFTAYRHTCWLDHFFRRENKRKRFFCFGSKNAKDQRLLLCVHQQMTDSRGLDETCRRAAFWPEDRVLDIPALNTSKAPLPSPHLLRPCFCSHKKKNTVPFEDENQVDQKLESDKNRETSCIRRSIIKRITAEISNILEVSNGKNSRRRTMNK